MDAKNTNFAQSHGSDGMWHVTMLYQVSWISWITITSLHSYLHQSPIVWHVHSWEQGTLGTKQKERQMVSCYMSSVTSLKPSFQCTLHGLFSERTLLVLAVTRNSQKNHIVVDFLVRNDFQRREGEH